jgi:SH3 domain
MQQSREAENQNPGQGTGGSSTNHILFYGEPFHLARTYVISNLFYTVKALYDYTATIQEEFDFQAGDVIAVTATPDDGWWSGELLDENRRVEGRHVFPSNFVCLF